MGVDITVLAVDWGHLMDIAPHDRAEVLQEAAYPDDDDRVVHAGWVWFAAPGPSWLGRFEFGGTLGSYSRTSPPRTAGTTPGAPSGRGCGRRWTTSSGP
ncbi:hypothetical protein ACWCXH_23225 [Kitasatospora sp. NPDC001660]